MNFVILHLACSTSLLKGAGLILACSISRSLNDFFYSVKCSYRIDIFHLNLSDEDHIFIKNQRNFYNNSSLVLSLKPHLK